MFTTIHNQNAKKVHVYVTVSIKIKDLGGFEKERTPYQVDVKIKTQPQ